jgi:biopolymer transport protein ExbB/TolQ
MFLQGWPVLSVLLLASILSVTVMWDRWALYRRARLDARKFVHSILQVIERQGVAAAIAHCERFPQPAARVVQAILLQNGDRAAKERTAEQALQAQIHDLEAYVPVLGTIGSIAPFIGLLGTVIGIIRAFIDMAIHSGGGVEVVASGIAEALITTAFGLFVAIPAVIGYNYCVNRIRRLAGEIDLAVEPVIARTATPGGGAHG